MAGWEIASLTLACMLAVLAGCSKSKSNGAPESLNACDRKLLTPADVAGILTDSVTGTKVIPGDAQSCEFVTSSFPGITVSVRPGLGRETVQAWSSGKMPLSSTPLSGVGEAAVWQPDLHEVIAQKNNLLCDIAARGLARDLAVSMAAAQKRLGALCNKIFTVF